MTRDQLADYLDNAAASLLDATKKENVEIRTGALIAYGLLKLGAGLARKGLDPVEHITRLLDIGPDMDAVDDDAKAAADAKFPKP